MSSHKVPLTTALSVNHLENSDSLDVVKVYGFEVVTKRDTIKLNQVVIYCPIDSILPQWLEDKMFSNSKIKLHKHRLRQTKIRGFYSQGLLIDPSDVAEGIASWAEKNKTKKVDLELEQDLSEMLDITKYEPEVRININAGKTPRNRPLENPYFRKYNGITNLKWDPNAFEGREVVIQEKYHGSHIRFGRAPFIANTIWKKVLKFFRLAPKFESVYGSNNVELTNRRGNKGFYGTDIYGTALDINDVFEFIEDGAFVHAELIGPGIQKNYTYGLKNHKIIVFDVRILQPDGTQKWLDPEDAEKWAKERDFSFAEVLYVGLFNRDILDKLTSGRCSLGDEVREGIVLKSRYNYDYNGYKDSFKSINPAYLADVTNSDEH